MQGVRPSARFSAVAALVVPGLLALVIASTPGVAHAEVTAPCGWDSGLQQRGAPPGASEAGDSLGAVVAVGDFDGDGEIDVAAGVPGENDGAGAVSIFYAPCRGRAPQLLSQRGSVPGRSEAGDEFGAALAVGDFNLDGFDDLAVGAPGEDIGGAVDAGAVWVFPGSASGIDVDAAISFSERSSGELLSFDGRYGEALAAGNVRGTMHDDLVIGSPGRIVGGKSAGGITTISGSPSGLIKSSAVLLEQGDGLSGSPEAGDRVGAAVAVGDFDADGRGDIAIGAPGEAIGRIRGAGLVHVVTVTSEVAMHQGTPGVPGANEAGDGFGSVLATGNVDGDIYDDLVVGVPNEALGASADAGQVIVMSGFVGGIRSEASGWAQSYKAVRGKAEAGDLFGASVVLADLDQNGRDEVVIGAPGEAIGATTASGAVHVFQAAMAGNPYLDVMLTQGSPRVPGALERDDLFGASVAAADGVVFVGAPGEAIGTAAAAGMVAPFGANATLRLQMVGNVTKGLTQGGLALSVLFESDDEVLFSYRADRDLIPASNEKVIVAMGAYELLPADFRYHTEVIIDANDDLYVIASGDPTLTHAGLKLLAERVVDAGISGVGDVVVVTGRYDSTILAPGVNASTMPTYSGPMSEFQVSDNRWRTDAEFLSNADRENGELFVTMLDAAWLDGNPGSDAFVAGSTRVGPLPRSATHVASVRSDGRDTLIASMMSSSDNQIADGLVREIAAQHTGFGTMAGGLDLITARLESLGAPPVTAFDGSGLSYWNMFSAGTAVALIDIAQGRPWWPQYFDALATAGVSGTLVNRLRGADTIDNVRAKTGTLFVSRTLAGIFTTAGGDDVRFAVFINVGTATRSDVSQSLDELDALVALVAGLE